ncbi:DUF2945 domain-containing protein [Sphingomonas sp. So64.6b]|nr:DUF2945 domain-containing protein [Sphingomonas sp. So64.6b]
MASVKTGDKVSWKSHAGTAHGTVVKKQTSDTRIKVIRFVRRRMIHNTS